MAVVAVVGVLLVGAVAVAAFVLTGGDDDLVASSSDSTAGDDAAEPAEDPEAEDGTAEPDPKDEEEPSTTVAEDEEAEVFDPDAGGPRTYAVDELLVGQCVAEDLGFLLTNLPEFTVVDCAQLHRAELYHRFEVLDGPYPGDEVIFELADDRCGGSAFTDYVGTAYEYSEVYVTQSVPTEGSWSLGDRSVVCFGHEEEPSVQTTLSFRNSGR